MLKDLITKKDMQNLSSKTGILFWIVFTCLVALLIHTEWASDALNKRIHALEGAPIENCE